MADPAAAEIDLTLRNARRAAVFAFACVLFVGLMLLIDGQRNRVMLAQVQEARRILDEFKAVASGAVAAAGHGDPAGQAGVGGTAGGWFEPGSDGRGDSGDDAGAGTSAPVRDDAAAETPAVPWPVREGTPGGVRGHEF